MILRFPYLLILVFFAFTANCEDVDEFIRVVQYEYDIPTIEEIVTFEEDYTIMRVKQNDYIYPIQLGKLLAYMKTDVWKDVQMKGFDKQIIFEQSETTQFFFFRISMPIPNEDATDYIVTPGVTVHYRSTANPYGLFQEGTTSNSNGKGEAVVGYSYDRTVPGAARKYLYQRMVDGYNAIFKMNLDDSTTLTLQQKILDIYDGLFVSGALTFEEEEPYEHIQKLVRWKEEFEPVSLEAGDVIYANSDESFHFWIGENGKDAYIVDVGSLFFTNGLQAVVDDISGIETLYIMQTHFHSEHIQGLAPLINRTDLPQFTMVVSTGLNLGFVGWLLENYDHVISKIESGQLNFIFADDQEWVPVGELEVKLLLTYHFEDPRVKHFISNTSPVLRDKNANYRIFSGDLQSPYYSYQPEDEFYEMIASSFSQIFAAAEIPESSYIDFYFGIGLFYWELMLYPWQMGEEDRVRVKDFLQYVYSYFSNYPKLDMQAIHITNRLGFNMALHKSFSKHSH